MLMASGAEWFPTLGALWQVVQDPVNDDGTPCLSFNPATPEIVIGSVLNNSSPRAIEARASLVGSLAELFRFSHLENTVMAFGSNAPGAPSGSLMPAKNF